MPDRPPAPTTETASKRHKWVKAPRSLFATYVCARCGRDSMVKHYGKCARAEAGT